MKNLKALVLLSILLLFAVKANGISVICTTTALETLVEEVGGERVDVISLVQPGVCPSHFDVRPSHISEVSQASLVVYHGVEPWLEDLITASGNVTIGKILLEGAWNSPPLTIKKIESIRDALSQVDPEYTDFYKANAEEAIRNVNATADKIKNDAEALELELVKVICMEWQASFIEWMGLSVVATYGPPELLSVKDLDELIATGKEEGAVLVIDNLQSGTEFGSEIASEIGAYHVVLTNFPNAVPGTDTIAQMLEYNASQLLDAVHQYHEEEGRISELGAELKEERRKKDLFEAGAVVLLIVCIVEALLLYARKK